MRELNGICRRGVRPLYGQSYVNSGEESASERV